MSLKCMWHLLNFPFYFFMVVYHGLIFYICLMFSMAMQESTQSKDLTDKSFLSNMYETFYFVVKASRLLGAEWKKETQSSSSLSHIQTDTFSKIALCLQPTPTPSTINSTAFLYFLYLTHYNHQFRKAVWKLRVFWKSLNCPLKPFISDPVNKVEKLNNSKG